MHMLIYRVKYLNKRRNNTAGKFFPKYRIIKKKNNILFNNLYAYVHISTKEASKHDKRG